MIEDETRGAGWSGHDGSVDGRTRDSRQIAVRASGVEHVIHADAEIQVRKQIVGVANIALKTRVEVSAAGAIE